MTVVVGFTEDYYIKSQQFRLISSLVSHWKGRVCVVCIDFVPNGLPEHWEVATVQIDSLPSYRKDWPKNDGRSNYVTIEAGDFLSLFSFKNDEIIVRIDADMIMQRPLSIDESAQLISLSDGQIAMSGSADPIATLREEFFRIEPTRSRGKIQSDFPGNWGRMPLYCCGVIACNGATYKSMSEHYLSRIDQMVYNFGHHAAGQWVFNYILATKFQAIDMGPVFHGAEWFIDSGHYIYFNSLKHSGELVAFNHHKFLRKFRHDDL
jgi:hypothetical protein